MLKKTLKGPTTADVLAATEGVMACLRSWVRAFRTGRSRSRTPWADNASCGVCSRAGRPPDPRDVDLGTCGMVLRKNGDIVATGAGALPPWATRPTPWPGWPTRWMRARHRALEAGEVILSGFARDHGAGGGRRRPARDHRRIGVCSVCFICQGTP